MWWFTPPFSNIWRLFSRYTNRKTSSKIFNKSLDKLSIENTYTPIYQLEISYTRWKWIYTQRKIDEKYCIVTHWSLRKAECIWNILILQNNYHMMFSSMSLANILTSLIFLFLFIYFEHMNVIWRSPQFVGLGSYPTNCSGNIIVRDSKKIARLVYFLPDCFTHGCRMAARLIVTNHSLSCKFVGLFCFALHFSFANRTLSWLHLPSITYEVRDLLFL
jgi:hypothetical protein